MIFSKGLCVILERSEESRLRCLQSCVGTVPEFTKRYQIDRLIYFQETNDIGAAIAAEKQIKGLPRPKKIAPIEAENPTWRDLSAESQEKTSLRFALE